MPESNRTPFGFALTAFLAFAFGQVSDAFAQSQDFMLNECSSIGQTYFRDFAAHTDMQYNGQRLDGTHQINGRIFLEARFEDFACSYDRSGRHMAEFVAEGRIQNEYLPIVGNAGQGSIVHVTDVKLGDTLNVRNGPGTSYGIVGALSNGTSVRNLGCRMEGNTRWCEIEMMTDMRERGWVAGRYLTLAGSTPSPASGPLETVKGVPANDVLNVRAGPGMHFRIVGALSNGSQVRNLGCQTEGNSRWCQIEMMTDMRERGWVNARFLTSKSGQASQFPSPLRMERVRLQPGASNAENFDEIAAGAIVINPLNARSGENLWVEFKVSGLAVVYRIFNADGSTFLEKWNRDGRIANKFGKLEITNSNYFSVATAPAAAER